MDCFFPNEDIGGRYHYIKWHLLPHFCKLCNSCIMPLCSYFIIGNNNTVLLCYDCMKFAHYNNAKFDFTEQKTLTHKIIVCNSLDGSTKEHDLKIKIDTNINDES